jgi:hypothetical protein
VWFLLLLNKSETLFQLLFQLLSILTEIATADLHRHYNPIAG